MRAMRRDFFQNLYTSEGTANMSAVLDHVPSKVTDSMNTFLCAPFTEKEVKATCLPRVENYLVSNSQSSTFSS